MATVGVGGILMAVMLANAFGQVSPRRRADERRYIAPCFWRTVWHTHVW
jgi:uncharacterized protein (TIGR03382 family)